MSGDVIVAARALLNFFRRAYPEVLVVTDGDFGDVYAEVVVGLLNELEEALNSATNHEYS